MSNVKEVSLKSCLNEARVNELPKQLKSNEKGFWLEAIVLVRKRDGSYSYAIAQRDASLKITYKADYGNLSPIISLVSIHPYMMLDKSKYMPYDNISQMRNALVIFAGGDEQVKEAVDAMPDDEVLQSTLEIAIEAQYSAADIMETHSNIINAVHRNKKDDVEAQPADNLPSKGKRE